MPRTARLVLPSIPHHITQRGNYRQKTPPTALCPMPGLSFQANLITSVVPFLWRLNHTEYEHFRTHAVNDLPGPVHFSAHADRYPPSWKPLWKIADQRSFN